MEIKLSTLPKTWIFDLDGTLVVHNGYKNGEDQLLPGVLELFEKIQQKDYVIILTAREEKYRKETEDFLHEHGIEYDSILFEMPCGERLLFNDKKPSGLSMAYAINGERNQAMKIDLWLDPTL